MLTGDSPFIGDVGRPDLVNLGGSTTADLARAMYHTIHDKLLTLPDPVSVMPRTARDHRAGKNLSTEMPCLTNGFDSCRGAVISWSAGSARVQFGSATRRDFRRASSSSPTSSSIGCPGTHIIVTTKRLGMSLRLLPSW